jgi:hypothetical protein
MATEKVGPPGPDQRSETLVRQRELKMARSAHAFVRGSTAKFYEWLEESKGKLPADPPSGSAGIATLVTSDRWRISTRTSTSRSGISPR